jgi:protein involved in polysaccharide export with SLBB domain
MFHRIINWITNPFKKQEVKITLPEVTPLSDEVKNKLIADLIEVAKEFKEKKEVDLDTLPLTRVSEETKEKIADLVKEDFKEKNTLNVEHQVVITESAPKKKKRYYKKKKATDSSK